MINRMRLEHLRGLLVGIPPESESLMDGLDLAKLSPGEIAMLEEFSERPKVKTGCYDPRNFAALNSAEAAKVFAIGCKAKALTPCIDGLHPECKAWWIEQWSSKPDVSTWSDLEACIFSELLELDPDAAPRPFADLKYTNMVAKNHLPH